MNSTSSQSGKMRGGAHTPKVTFLVPDMSSNILWAATAMARAIEAWYPVEIVGPDLGGGVCPMYRGFFPYTAVPASRLYRLPDFLWQAGRIHQAITGDIVIAVKAFADTLPVALWQKWFRGKKAVVYLDEWDGASFHGLSNSAKAGLWFRHVHHPLEENYHSLVERLIPRADAVISTGTFLQRKFGGSIIPLGADTNAFKPQPAEETAMLKKRLGLEGKKLVVFGGVVRPHKGIEDLLEAIVRLDDPLVRLVIVGPENEHVQVLKQTARYSGSLVCVGPQSREAMPAFLGLADLIAIPLLNNPLAQSQMPCKVFEAMAMAKPIVATAVSDLPVVLEGCGWVVPAGDASAMANAIRHVLDHPDDAHAKGRAAREKCIACYSSNVTEQQLVSIVSSLVGQA